MSLTPEGAGGLSNTAMSISSNDDGGSSTPGSLLFRGLPSNEPVHVLVRIYVVKVTGPCGCMWIVSQTACGRLTRSRIPNLPGLFNLLT